MVSTIGLKIANGEFYSIVDENSQSKKRLVLTTVHDNQHSAQIDLYRSYTRTMADALYIGSLVVENIKPMPKGEPSIELVIASASNGNINADAIDMDAASKNGRQSLSVSLRSLDEDTLGADLPDFELENDAAPEGLYEKASKRKEELDGERRKFPWLVVIFAALILTAIALVVWLFFVQNNGGLAALRGRSVTQVQQPAQPPAPQQAQGATPAPTAPPPVQPTTPPPAAQAPAQPVTPAPAAPPPAQPAATPTPAQPATPPPVAQAPVQPVTPAPTAPPPAQPITPAPVTPPPAPPPVIQAPAQAPVVTGADDARLRTPPVAGFNVPAVIPREGVLYIIRYGDTLWDIAEAFYRNPFLYPHIARFNNISNPNFIIAGTAIRVPPRN